MTQPVVTVHILRSGNSRGLTRYQVSYEDNMTVLRVLEKIYTELDPTLAFRHYCCKIGRCGSCAVKVNGKTVLGCKEAVAPGQELRIEPVGNRRKVRDLVVDYTTSIEGSLPTRPLKSIVE